ncbi:adenosine receptor A2a-like [Alosa sapidissima]|uniref:adenosine receptor A2a-like n=1 Tax=Alosa sapidissima TaxID=34773 RepID=UPI001C08D535|nr:adenosine receptor A2a-like [Alosa sapidissima]
MNETQNISMDIYSAKVPKLYLDGPYIAAELVIATVSTTGNFLVCLAVKLNKRLQTVTNYFLVSLAVADFFVGALAIPCAILTNLGVPYHNLYLCILMLSVLIMLTHTSIFSLLAVAVERYIAILLPLHYQRIMRPCNARLIILVTWVLAFLTGSIPLMGWHKTPPQSSHCFFDCFIDLTYMVYFNFFGCVLVLLVVMFIIYGHIFATVRRQMRRITTLQTAGEVPASRAASVRREVRKATSLFLLLFLFTVCWVPMHVVNCFLLLCPRCTVPVPIMLMAIILSHANSAFNPLLYAYRMKSYRQTIKSVFRSCRATVKPGE